jgi:ribosomal protein L11 methyltransferase
VKEQYICLSVTIPDRLEEIVGQLFWQYDCQGLMIDDPRMIAEHLQRRDWEASVFAGQQIITGHIEIRAWFAADEAGRKNIGDFREALASLLTMSDLDEKDITIKQTLAPNVDWVAEFKKHFHMRLIGQNIIIKPSWEEYKPQAGQIIIEMDPGMAFGSGDHTTTALCLAALEKYLPPTATVADIGCGSAILAIAAALLGAQKVWAVDNDAQAVQIAKENIALNKVSHIVQVTCGHLADEGREKFDVIMANIVADPIIELIPRAAHLLVPQGFFIASGILQSRAAEVEEVLLRHGFSIQETWLENGWYAVVAMQQ